jgi:hypothetical protein
LPSLLAQHTQLQLVVVVRVVSALFQRQGMEQTELTLFLEPWLMVQLVQWAAAEVALI